ncbi:hypothetical protein [Roseivirga pacifica]
MTTLKNLTFILLIGLAAQSCQKDVQLFISKEERATAKNQSMALEGEWINLEHKDVAIYAINKTNDGFTIAMNDSLYKMTNLKLVGDLNFTLSLASASGNTEKYFGHFTSYDRTALVLTPLSGGQSDMIEPISLKKVKKETTLAVSLNDKRSKKND